jgi:hypothetical protein
MSPQFNLIGIWNFGKNIDTPRRSSGTSRSTTGRDGHTNSKAYDFPMEIDHWAQPMPVIGNDPKLKQLPGHR